MGLFKYGAQCCNNCWNWECHSERKIRGNPPNEIYTDSNCDKCSKDGRTHLSKDCCPRFRHYDGATITFPLEKDEPTPSESGDYLNGMISAMDEPSRAYMQSMVDLVKSRAGTQKSTQSRVEEQEYVPRKVRHTCSRCNGTGRTACGSCGGSGHHECSSCDGNGGFKTELEIREDYKTFTKKQHWLPDIDLDIDDFYGFNGWGDSPDDMDECMVLCDQTIDVAYDDGPKTKTEEVIDIRKDDIEFADGTRDELKEKVFEEYKRACGKVDDAAYDWAKGSWGNPGYRIKNASLKCTQTPCIVELRIKDALGFPCKVLINLANGKVHVYEIDKDVAAPILAEWEKKAKCGDVEAQNVVGKLYSHYGNYNHVVEKDEETAFHWFLKAAKGGCLDAMDNLGNCYKDGDGIEKDLELAIEWYMKAAKAGLPWGQYHLARCFLNGTGVEEDNDMALLWYMRAAKQGLPIAQRMVGRCAYNGWGMDEDAELSFFWMQKAANGGDAEAMNYLGKFYADGYGCDQDSSKSNAWKDKAKAHGYVEKESSNSGW